MKAFCVKCGVFASIQELEGVAELYRVLDGYLSDYMKKRMQIQPDGHCLQRAVFNGLKRKGFLPDHYNYKELFRDVISDIKYNDIYSTWMSDSKEEVFRCLAEYQNKKIYTSNIVDIVIVALATVANITIVTYYLDGLTVKNNVFKPTQKQSIAIVEVCFINGHYDLIVNATAQAELEYESIIFNQNFKTSAKETHQKSPPSKIQHALQFFSSTQRFKCQRNKRRHNNIH